MDIRTESRNIPMAPRWQEEIERRLHDLQNGRQDILHARMTLERNRHHNKGPKIASARLVCHVRGATFTASKTDKTFEDAIRATFLAMEEEIQSYRERRKQRARTESARRAPARPGVFRQD
jgi:ribosome-associated translation inhibitor RaiA